MRIQPKTKRTIELISNTYGYYIIKVIYEDRSEGILIEKFGSSSQSPMHDWKIELMGQRRAYLRQFEDILNFGKQTNLTRLY